MIRKFTTPQEGLFEAPQQTIEELVEEVKLQREAALAQQAAAPAVEPPETSPNPRKGGAFGGALKRHIEETDQEEKFLATNTNDIYLLRPTSLSRQLFHAKGDLVYKRITFMPSEFKAITFAPSILAQRIGANVLDGTVARPPTERHERKAEVLQAQLEKRQNLVRSILTELAIDEDVYSTLLKEMKSPGYSHMSQDEMDALMAHAEWRFVGMFEAITENHEAGTERVNSLKAALDYLLNNDYRSAFRYWRHMSDLGLAWTRAKINRLAPIEQSIQEELEKRFGATSSVQ